MLTKFPSRSAWENAVARLRYEYQAAVAMPRKRVIRTNTSSESTGTVTAIYAAKTTFTQGFKSGSLTPLLQRERGDILLRKAPICEKKSGMPVRSASAQ